MFFFFITFLSLLGRRLIGDWSAISRGPVPDRSATSCIKSQRGPNEVADQSPISRRPVPDQSPTSRRPTAKPSCDSSATSAIVMNFGRGEVAERLQCMSDLGFTGSCPKKWELDSIRLDGDQRLYHPVYWFHHRKLCIGVHSSHLWWD